MGSGVLLEDQRQTLLQRQLHPRDFLLGRGQFGLGLADVSLVAVVDRKRNPDLDAGNGIAGRVVVLHARLQIDIGNPPGTFSAQGRLGTIDAGPSTGKLRAFGQQPVQGLLPAELGHAVQQIARQRRGLHHRVADHGRQTAPGCRMSVSGFFQEDFRRIGFDPRLQDIDAGHFLRLHQCFGRLDPFFADADQLLG